jgi:hypothetical protein
MAKSLPTLPFKLCSLFLRTLECHHDDAHKSNPLGTSWRVVTQPFNIIIIIEHDCGFVMDGSRVCQLQVPYYSVWVYRGPKVMLWNGPQGPFDGNKLHHGFVKWFQRKIPKSPPLLLLFWPPGLLRVAILSSSGLQNCAAYWIEKRLYTWLDQPQASSGLRLRSLTNRLQDASGGAKWSVPYRR